MNIKLFYKNVRYYLLKKVNINEELMWANVWHDTIKGIDWCENIGSISPGRFAVGYNYLYVMTRVLNEVAPKNVLDLGLGISSSLINSYYCGNEIENGTHIIVEHDKAWIEFYQKKHILSKSSKILWKQLSMEGKNKKQCIEYVNFEEEVVNKKYNVISIDAPFGSERNSRHDVLDIIPKCLDNQFVIMIDDAHRRGEKDTIKRIKQRLEENNIKYATRLYKGLTYCYIIVSEDLKYLCSL